MARWRSGTTWRTALAAVRALSVLMGLAILASPAVAQSRVVELLVVEKAGCPWCVAWDREVAPAYERSAEGRIAPIRRMDIAEWRRSGIRFLAPLTATPTFVLVADDREIGRITGYPGADFFWGLLGEMLAKLPPEEPEPAAPPRDARALPGPIVAQR